MKLGRKGFDRTHQSLNHHGTRDAGMGEQVVHSLYHFHSMGGHKLGAVDQGQSFLGTKMEWIFVELGQNGFGPLHFSMEVNFAQPNQG